MISLVAAGLVSAMMQGQDAKFLVRDGEPKCVIELAASASPSMRHGADELQKYIGEISGAKLPIEGLDSTQTAIRLEADPRMKSEDYRISTTVNGLVIKGGALRGVMYGCYAYLEDVLGVRWYTRTITKIPHRQSIPLTKLDMKGSPAFEYREPFFTEAFDRDWAVRNRTNGNSQQLDKSVGGKVSYGPFVHTFSDIAPAEKYFDAHPEYFSMVDGKRVKGYHQLCLSNPEVLKLAIARVEDWIKQYPDATIFSVSQNDTYYNCQCPECKAIEKAEGAPSGPLIRFVNKVAEAIGKKHPHVLIDTLAYQWSEKPPLKVRPRANVRIRIAPIGACFSHPLDGCTENATPYKNLLDWSKVTKNIYIWHYTTNFANYLDPLPNLDEIAGDTALFKKNGVVGFFDEGDYSGGGEMAELKSYLLAKLMWDPFQPARPIIEDFVNGVYGSGAPYILKWLDLTHAAGRAMKAHARIYDPPTALYLSDEVLQEGDRLFDQAEEATQGSVTNLEAVQQARLSLEYVHLMRTDPKSVGYSALAKTVGDKCKKFKVGGVREGEPIEAFLKRIGQG
ncbi:MAG: DUF4838 domain-containing protein [Fimbriimonas sp.]|nr:DUF4838 domain-containing protein [Fimbriimonas sp.]